jgi:hypothetical protein
MDDIKQKVKFEMEMGGIDDVNEKLKELEKETEATSKQVDKIAASSSKATEDLKRMAVEFISVAAAIRLVKEVVSTYVQEFNATVALTGALYDNAAAAGLNTDEFQALDYIMRRHGGSAGDAANAIRALTTALVSGSEEGARKRESIEALGLSYQSIVDMAPEEAFVTIADAVKQLSTTQERNMALGEIFGRRHQMIASVLNQSTESIREQMTAFQESNLLIAGDTVATYDAFGDAQVLLQQRMNALKAEGFLPLVEAILNMTDTMGDAAENVIPEFIDPVANAAWVVGRLAESMASLAEKAPFLSDALRMQGDATLYAFAPTTLLNDIITKLRENEEDTTDAVEALALAQQREAEGTELAVIAQRLMNDELDIGPQQLRNMAAALADMTAMNEAAAPWLQQVTERLAQCTWQTTDALGKIDTYTDAEFERAIAIRETNIALLQQWEAQGKVGPAMQRRIEQIRAEIAALNEQRVKGSGSGGGGGGTGGGVRVTTGVEDEELDPKAGGITKADALARELADRMAAEEEYMNGLGEMRLSKEAQFDEMMAEREMAAWETRYEIGMHYAGLMSNMLVSEWENGFKDIDKAFGKMVTRMVAELASSGLLSWASSLLGGGPVGIFGQIFGGGK